MKLPQFKIRTLLLVTAAMGVIFVACADSVIDTSGRPVHLLPGGDLPRELL